MKLKSVQKACQITDSLLSSVLANFPSFKTEKDIKNFILKQLRQRRLQPAFPPLIVSQANAHQIHHQPDKTKLQGFVILDLGVKYQGYCSDLTRTVFVGHPKKQDFKLYQLVLKTQQKTIQKIKVGQPYSQLDAYSRKLFGSYSKYFKHALGHGVGKKIHQKPKVSPHSKNIIKIGDVIAIEPGLYKRNCFGIRIEDTIYLGKKPITLTKSPKKLFTFPKPL